MRRLVLAADTYRWRVSHRRGRALTQGSSSCGELFTAFAERHPRSPLRILFPETSEHGPGFPRARGVVVDYALGGPGLNLNRPRLARLLIELCLDAGWAPERARRELLVPDGYRLLRENRARVEAVLAEGAAHRDFQAKP